MTGVLTAGLIPPRSAPIRPDPRLVAEPFPAVAVGHEETVVAEPQKMRGTPPDADRARHRPIPAPSVDSEWNVPPPFAL